MLWYHIWYHVAQGSRCSSAYCNMPVQNMQNITTWISDSESCSTWHLEPCRPSISKVRPSISLYYDIEGATCHRATFDSDIEGRKLESPSISDTILVWQLDIECLDLRYRLPQFWEPSISNDLEAHRRKLPGSPADQNNVEHQRGKISFVKYQWRKTKQVVLWSADIQLDLCCRSSAASNDRMLWLVWSVSTNTLWSFFERRIDWRQVWPLLEWTFGPKFGVASRV